MKEIWEPIAQDGNERRRRCLQYAIDLEEAAKAKPDLQTQVLYRSLAKSWRELAEAIPALRVVT